MNKSYVFQRVHLIGEGRNPFAIRGIPFNVALLVIDLWDYAQHEDDTPASRFELEQLARVADEIIALEIRSTPEGKFDPLESDLCSLLNDGLMRDRLSSLQRFRDRWIAPPVFAACALRMLDGILADNFGQNSIMALAEVARLSLWAVGAGETTRGPIRARRQSQTFGSLGGKRGAMRWKEVELEAVRLANEHAPPGEWRSAQAAAKHILPLVSAFARSKGEDLSGDDQQGQIARWLRQHGIKRPKKTS